MNDAQRIAWIDQSDAEVSANIRRYGTHIVYVSWDGGCSAPGCSGGDPSDGPPFGYTVGLFGLGHPELLILRRQRRDHGRRAQRADRTDPGGRRPGAGRAGDLHRVAAPDRGRVGAQPGADRVRGQPVLPPAGRGVGARAAAVLRRPGGPLPVGAGLRGAGAPTAAGHLTGLRPRHPTSCPPSRSSSAMPLAADAPYVRTTAAPGRSASPGQPISTTT